MASVRNTVLNMMIHYPNLFKNVSDCFDHLFLSYGNGYEWVNGELYPCDDGIYTDYTGKQYQWHEPRFLTVEDELAENPYRKNNMDLTRLHVKRHNLQVQFVVDNIDAMMMEPISLRNPHTAFCEYSAIYSDPKYITNEWYQAIVKTIYALQAWLNCPSRLYDIHSLRHKLNTCIEENHTDIILQRETLRHIVEKMQNEST